jgi:type IV fimbrial biogenesis protein FimT
MLISRVDRPSGAFRRSSENPGRQKPHAYIRCMNGKKQHGFTLYELLITLLVVGIVLTIGIPNLGDFTRNGRITGTANDLHSSFMVARSEAARAKTNVTICASADPMGAAANCDGESFEQGWIVFVDVDNGDIWRADVGTDIEYLLRRHPPVHENISINTNGATFFSFAANGLGRGAVNGVNPIVSAMICDDRGIGASPAAGGSSTARRLVVTPVGRSVVIRDHDLVAEHEC